MAPPTKPVFQHVALYGQTAQQNPAVAGPIPDDFTFNSLVGCCMDREQRLWVCDTGNNRVLVLDKNLLTILAVLPSPQPGADGAGGVDFRMPFHLCQHPAKNRMYITDMGNARVVVMDYDHKGIHFSHEFGNTNNHGGAALQDPNGITIVKDGSKGGKGNYFVHVDDEFFHTDTDKLRNRCVRYTDEGAYVSEFRGVIDPDGSEHDIYWPQGLSSDLDGNLYIANTGNYEILKVSATAKVDANYCVHAKKPVVQYRFGQPTGLGMMNIMRFVSVIGKHVFVPDHILNTISVFDLAGKLQCILSGIRPSWNHGDDPVHSASDALYYAEEDALLLNPYVICQGESEDVYFVTEPFSSRLIKLRIPQLIGPSPVMTMLASLGARRNQPGKDGADPQFNCVTAVAGFSTPRLLQQVASQKAQAQAAPHHSAFQGLFSKLPQGQSLAGIGSLLAQPLAAFKSGAEMMALPPDVPAWVRYNPFEQWYLAAARVTTAQYEFWLRQVGGKWPVAWSQHAEELAQEAAEVRLNMDAGNWRIKAYMTADGAYDAVAKNIVNGYFLPGNLSMTLYYPKTALLGQICPGSPILFVANFNFGTISMYQISPTGQLLNYGVPFGVYGQANGCMRGPQGMAVSDDGEVFIVDSLNNRIGKWQILQSGQVVFIKNFIWSGKDADTTFTPTDIALDAMQRLFVTDQFNNRICAFDRNGASLWCVGKEGYWQEGEPDGMHFMLPTSLAVDGEHLILNDLVNRALKLFRIEADGLRFMGGISLFKLGVYEGGVWMPFFMYARDRQVYIADSTYNIVQVFAY